MRKSWGLTAKILSGEKTIESRWYMNRSRPWGNINANDTIYFKDTGEPITVKATVDKVLCFENLSSSKVRELLEKYHKQDGISDDQFEYYYELFRSKKFCILIFLKDVQKVKPFEIDKKGFGTMAAWICIEDLNEIVVA